MKPKKRNRIVVILLFPILVFICLIGWGLYWIGNKKQYTPQVMGYSCPIIMGGKEMSKVGKNCMTSEAKTAFEKEFEEKAKTTEQIVETQCNYSCRIDAKKFPKPKNEKWFPASTIQKLEHESEQVEKVLKELCKRKDDEIEKLEEGKEICESSEAKTTCEIVCLSHCDRHGKDCFNESCEGCTENIKKWFPESYVQNVLSERANKLLAELTRHRNHTFTYGEIVRLIVKAFPEIKTVEGVLSEK